MTQAMRGFFDDQREFVFAHPWVLLLLLTIPVLAILKGRRGPEQAVQFSSLQVLKALGPPARSRVGRVSRFLTMLAIAAGIVALARPQWQKTLREDKASGVDIMVAIDISQSMRVQDFMIGGTRVNRLQAAKSVLLDFIDARPDDRIGVIAFAGRPYLYSPLTLDHHSLIQRVSSIEIANRNIEQGTAIGLAIAAATGHLDKREFKSKVVVVLTDGENKWGLNPLEAAEIARTLNVKVYTIGAGTDKPQPIPYVTQVPRKEFDEEMLKEVAKITGAKYYHASDTSRMGDIFDEIGHLEKSEVLRRTNLESDDLWTWPGGTAILALSISCLFGLTLGRRVP